MKMSRTAKIMLMRDTPDVDSRFRDNRGREHYDNGRYAPARSEYMPPYSTGYRSEPKYEYGNYPRQNWDDTSSMDMRRGEPRNNYDVSWDGSGRFRKEFDTGEGSRRMIGFGGPEMHVENPWPTDEIKNRTGQRERGYSSSDVAPPMNRERVEEWMKELHNEDGTTGAHWSFDQAVSVMKQKNYDVDPVEFYAAINMMYSDYFKVAKKLNVNTLDFYGCMADAFLNDKDAVPDKLAAYYACIVK